MPGVTATGRRTGRFYMVAWRTAPDLFSPVSGLACVDRNTNFTFDVMVCPTVAFVKRTVFCFLCGGKTR